KYLPVVIWHGRLQTCCDSDVAGLQEFINNTLPGIYTHSIMLGKDVYEDGVLSVYGNANEQVDCICKQLKDNENLRNGFNAVGLSQGGLLLRAYVERCNDPPVHNLITMGSPQAGASFITHCDLTNDLCKQVYSGERDVLYSDEVRYKFVSAQWFKDPENIDTYLEKNIFLPDINNEHMKKNVTYANNLSSLNKFVLIRFTEDRTIVPIDSAWFSFYDKDYNLIPIRKQKMYLEDWIGLKKLDESGNLVFKEIVGDHLVYTYETFKEEVLDPYLR
ncbi:7672_t:CDS:2, partial [Diversispora eburnea]